MLKRIQGELERFALLKIRPVTDFALDKKGKCIVCEKTTVFHFNSWIVSKDIEKQINNKNEFEKLLARESYFCRVCLTSDRKRILYIHLLQTLSDKTGNAILNLREASKDLSVLVIGNLGRSSYLQNLVTKNLTCTTTYYDLEKEFGILHKSEVNADIQNLPFRSRSFDLVIHTDVLEHCENPQIALDSCLRVLKNDGSLIFTIPINSRIDESFSTKYRAEKIWHGRGKWIFSILPKTDGYLERHVFGKDYSQYLYPNTPNNISAYRYLGTNKNEILILQIDKSRN